MEAFFTPLIWLSLVGVNQHLPGRTHTFSQSVGVAMLWPGQLPIKSRFRNLNKYPRKVNKKWNSKPNKARSRVIGSMAANAKPEIHSAMSST
jgi:hypothetical protein